MVRSDSECKLQASVFPKVPFYKYMLGQERNTHINAEF